MRPMLFIQCLGIFGAIVTQVLTHRYFSGSAPEWKVLSVDVVWSLFIAWWVASVISFRITRRITEDTPDGWFFHSLGIFWSGNVATLISLFTLSPYGSLDWLLLACAFCMAPMILEAIGTVRSPRFGVRPLAAIVVPAVLPLVMAPWLLFHEESLAQQMGVFYLLFLVLLIFLRELIQSVVNSLERARGEAEQERDARTRFLASVSHDLAQPVHAARLFFEQALLHPAGAARDDAERHAHIAFDSTERLLSQILDRMRLAADAMKPSMQWVDVGAAIQRAVVQTAPLAELQGVQLRWVPSSIEVWGDAGMIDRVLCNLIGNALRHAQPRRVLVGARHAGSRARFWVIDDGIGIADEDLAGLFEEFVQGRRGDDVPPGGFGLGLSSSRQMAELMSGSLFLAPRGPRGAAFCLELSRHASPKG